MKLIIIPIIILIAIGVFAFSQFNTPDEEISDTYPGELTVDDLNFKHIDKITHTLIHEVNQELWRNEMKDLLVTRYTDLDQIEQNMKEAEDRFEKQGSEVPLIEVDIVQSSPKFCDQVPEYLTGKCDSNLGKTSIPITKIFEVSKMEYVQQIHLPNIVKPLD